MRAPLGHWASWPFSPNPGLGELGNACIFRGWWYLRNLGAIAVILRRGPLC